MEVVQEAFRRYRKLAIAFNGSKESMVLAHLLKGALRAPLKPLEEEIRTPLEIPSFEQTSSQKGGSGGPAPLWFRVADGKMPILDEFYRQICQEWGLEVIEFEDCDMKSALDYLLRHHQVEGVFLGVRQADYPTTPLDTFVETSEGWPKTMRILPLLHWSYRDVWKYIDEHNLPVCKLYSEGGFTSIKNEQCSFPNYTLWNSQKGGWDHARTLGNISLERVGRITTPLPISVQGKVIHGQGRGKQMGMPTANLENVQGELVSGVFCGVATLRGESFPCVCSVGKNVTFEMQEETFEVHLITPQALEDFYGEMLSVNVTHFIRPMLKFSSQSALMEAIQRDLQVGGTTRPP